LPGSEIYLSLSHLRRTVARRCSGPPRIDNLHPAAGCGIIRDGFATTRTVDRQFPAWHPGKMARRRSRDLQHPMFGR
jgi:hypothetical protein